MTRLLLLLALAGLPCAFSTPSQAHSWYDFKCCNEGDCRQTTLGEVERTDDGWLVVRTHELIRFDDERLHKSLDPLIHICLRQDGFTRCLYIPDQGG